VVAKAVWEEMRRCIGYNVAIHDVYYVTILWDKNGDYNALNVIHAALLWVLWLTRNVFQTIAVVWHAGGVEEICLHPCSLEHPARRGGKRKSQSSGSQPRELGVCSTTAIVAGAWVTPEKKLRTKAEINVHNQAGDGSWKIWQEL
jgi:hypothetical protein